MNEYLSTMWDQELLIEARAIGMNVGIDLWQSLPIILAMQAYKFSSDYDTGACMLEQLFCEALGYD